MPLVISDVIIFQVQLRLQNLVVILLKYLFFWLIFMQRNITTAMFAIMKPQSRFKIPKIFPPWVKSVTPLQKLSPTLISVFTQEPIHVVVGCIAVNFINTSPPLWSNRDSFCSETPVGLFTSTYVFPPNFVFYTNFSSRHVQTKTNVSHSNNERQKKSI